MKSSVDTAATQSAAEQRNRRPRATVSDRRWIVETVVSSLARAAWALPFAVLLGLAAFWCSTRSLTLKDENVLTAYSLSMLVFGLIALARTPFLVRIGRLSPLAKGSVCIFRDALAILVAAICSVIAMELPYNWAISRLPFYWVSIEFALTLAILVGLYFLAQRFGIGPILGVTVFTVYGIAQHFIVLFKGATILPSDLLALSTAMEVSGGYTYEFTDEILLALIAGAGSIVLLMLVRPARRSGIRTHALNLGANLCVAAAFLGGTFGWGSTVDFEKDLGFAYDYWMPAIMYAKQGSLTSFMAVLQDLPIDKPEDYSDKQARSIQDELAAQYQSGRGSSPERTAAVEQFNQVKPTVIAIMNETFSDLSTYDNLRANYAGPQRYNSLPDALSRGSLAVSVCGGGTANSEFEFLTGNSLAFVGGGKYPYTLFNFSKVDSLVSQFRDLGYTATAMHPNAPNNWNRASVYRQLGFESFLSIDDFEGDPTFHSGVTDGATYDKILELLESNDDPQFIFDVTMQNHSGYEPYGIPADQIPSYRPEGVTDENLISQLNVYLSCIEASDRDFASFLDRLRTLDRPVVVVFFGDHQPNFANTLNDALYPEEQDATIHSERTMHTTYTVWANYDVAGNDQTSLNQAASASTLGAQVLDMIGAPLTAEQQAQLAVRESVPQLNLTGYQGADGTWYDLETTNTPYTSLVDDLSRIQYLNFARVVD